MTRRLPITAAELAGNGDARTLWIVLDPYPARTALDPFGTIPSEFVLACAPCEWCTGTHEHHYEWGGKAGTSDPCHVCRIELVRPCQCQWPEDACPNHGTVTLGHAYAVGQPVERPDGRWALQLEVLA